MANELFMAARESFLRGEIAWDSDEIKVCLIDIDEYSPDTGSDQFLSDIPGAAIVAMSEQLENKGTSGGEATADDVVFPAVTGDECEALIIFQDTGSASTSRLIAYIDSAQGLPAAPNGLDITVKWSAYILKL